MAHTLAQSSAATAQTLQAATLATRDRYVDLIRAAAILLVVFGHWLMAVVDWDGPVWMGNLLVILPQLQFLTWTLQIMPLFFFVGGFATLLSLRSTHRKGGGYADFVYHRSVRLLRPIGFFFAIWVPLAIALQYTRPTSDAVHTLCLIAVQPLWFIGVYMSVIGLTPVTRALHRRWGAAVPVALFAIAVAVDIIRFTLDLDVVGLINLGVIWLLAYQLGYFYADGRLQKVRRVWLAAVVIGSIALLIGLTTYGPYPRSLVGLPGDRFSNMFPPTLCIAVLVILLVALAMLLREPLTRFVQRRKVWAAVVAINMVMMTIFLWHLTAFGIAVGALRYLGISLPTPGTVTWVIALPLWIGLLAAILFGLVKLFGRVDKAPLPQRAIVGPRRPRTVVAAIGLIYVVLGILFLAFAGLNGLVSGEVVQEAGLSISAFVCLVRLALGTALILAAVNPAMRRPVAAVAAVFAVLACAEALGLFGPAIGGTVDAVVHMATALVLVAALVATGLHGSLHHAHPAPQQRT
ncbi:MAG: acyltransferase [Anaerolineae bacterium]